ASAAALTLGVVTIPVYEIYKVGEDPRWLPGLDLLRLATGLSAAVVPHWDNAEGGNHDTRFCYMGETRLRALERQLPEGAFILGVDSHTALVIDLDGRSATIAGLGGVTVRVAGRGTFFPSGSEITIATLAEVAAALADGQPTDIGWEPSRGPARVAGGHASTTAGRTPPLRDEMADLEGTFVGALGQGDSRAAVAALLDLDSAIEARMRSGEDSPDLDGARSTFRALITRLGEASGPAGPDRQATIEPFVATLVELRDRAREARDWALADLIRDRLVAAGIEVRDGGDGSTWTLA
ncbi:MAG: CysS/YqeB C-terminal domain-containing protein, partial [Candidatus Limnocylindrales bacterium]